MQAYAVCIPNLAPETDPANFVDQGELIEDKSTGLMWQRCSMGLTWDAASHDCLVTQFTTFRFTWADALVNANTSRLGGFSNWRIPNKNELLSIVDHACTGPAINETLFPGTPYLSIGSTPPHFWTSSPSVNFPGRIWVVLATTGEFLPLPGTELHYVRMVRDTK